MFTKGPVRLWLLSVQLVLPDDGSIAPPEGVDLTPVQWNAPCMQALLGIDTSIVVSTVRPETDRIPWIVAQEDHDLLTMKRTAPKVEGNEEMMEAEQEQREDTSGMSELFAVLFCNDSLSRRYSVAL